MPSLDRAYGMRGALIALGMAAVAGGVHGVIGWAGDYLLVKIALGMAGALVLIMAGAISARHGLVNALGLGLAMGALYFVARWTGWSLMENGFGHAAEFLTTLPWRWPVLFDARGISGYWIVEAVSMCVPALIGCYTGQERGE